MGAFPARPRAPRACPAANFAESAGGRRPETPGPGRARIAWGQPGKGRVRTRGARAWDICCPHRYWARWGEKGRTGCSGKGERMEGTRTCSGTWVTSSGTWVTSPSGAGSGVAVWKGLKSERGARPVGTDPSLSPSKVVIPFFLRVLCALGVLGTGVISLLNLKLRFTSHLPSEIYDAKFYAVDAEYLGHEMFSLLD